MECTLSLGVEYQLARHAPSMQFSFLLERSFLFGIDVRRSARSGQVGYIGFQFLFKFDTFRRRLHDGDNCLVEMEKFRQYVASTLDYLKHGGQSYRPLDIGIAFCFSSVTRLGWICLLIGSRVH